MHLTKNDRKAEVCSTIPARNPATTNEPALRLQEFKSLKGMCMKTENNQIIMASVF